MSEDIQKARLMILSLGGTPLPIIKSLSTYRPERVIFFASHDSVSQSGEILGKLEPMPEREFEITDDPNCLSECYRKARRCYERAEKYDFEPDEIMVDYTGGTKVMSSALLIAGAGRHYRFNYVGGSQRTKNGVGIVLNGRERLFVEMSPWSVWAEEERRQVKTLFNRRRFSAVIEIIDGLLERELPVEVEKYFRFTRQVAFGLLRWDQFEHKKALDLLCRGIKELGEYLRANPNPDLDEFRQQLDGAAGRLRLILERTDELKEPHGILIFDLINNARRKMEDKRNDDAASRLYRAVELYGQICFREATGVDNDNVKAEMLPEPIRKEFTLRYQAREGGNLKLPLEATYRFLDATGHDAGARFISNHGKLQKIQYNRNHSILAHGLNPVSDKAVESIYQTVAEFIRFDDLHDFPRLP